jgi:hypothetical protein
MKPDLHGAIMDCERITNPHSKAQVQMVLMSIAEGCAACEHYKATASCWGCEVSKRVEEARASIADKVSQNPCRS